MVNTVLAATKPLMQNHSQLFEMFKHIWGKMFSKHELNHKFKTIMNFPRLCNFKYFTFTLLLMRYRNWRQCQISGNEKLLSAINVKGPNDPRQNVWMIDDEVKPDEKSSQMFKALKR